MVLLKCSGVISIGDMTSSFSRTISTAKDMISFLISSATGEMIKILDEHLELIAKNQKRTEALLNNAELTSKAIIVQKEALEKRPDQVNDLQKLVEQNGGGS